MLVDSVSRSTPKAKRYGWADCLLILYSKVFSFFIHILETDFFSSCVYVIVFVLIFFFFFKMHNLLQCQTVQDKD